MLTINSTIKTRGQRNIFLSIILQYVITIAYVSLIQNKTLSTCYYLVVLRFNLRSIEQQHDSLLDPCTERWDRAGSTESCWAVRS